MSTSILPGERPDRVKDGPTVNMGMSHIYEQTRLT